MDVLVWIGMYGITFVAIYALAPYHQRMIDHRDRWQITSDD